MDNQILIGKNLSKLSTKNAALERASGLSQQKDDVKKIKRDNAFALIHGLDSEDSTAAPSDPASAERVELKVITESMKKKLSKVVNNQYEYNRRQFLAASWAYLKHPDSFINTTTDNFISSHLDLLFSKYDENKPPVREESVPESLESNEQSSSYENTDSEDMCEDIPDLFDNEYFEKPEHTLKNRCENFFKTHGLVVKVRRLPLDYNKPNGTQNRRPAKALNTLSLYPPYHFISRHRRHLFEQLMRSRTFLDTRYNSCNEMRNSKSPFSLFEVHPNILNHFNELKNDFSDPEFSGVYISLNTKPYQTTSEFGKANRTKLIAWALVEILTNNERCLKCLWIHPSISATGTTDVLSAFLPYVIFVSFSVKPPSIDLRYQNKLFYVWLSDFDHFPRQTLVLLTSVKRFGLIKHYDRPENSQTKDVTRSHADAGIQDEKCFCNSHANWNDCDQVILGCTEQLMHILIPKWIKVVKQGYSTHLLDDLEKITSPDILSSSQKSTETVNEIKTAEFTGLEHSEIRDLMMHLYGARWRLRLKIKTLRNVKLSSSSYTSKDEYSASSNEREQRRKRREQKLYR
ncbi:hypothetical protein BEWA_030640 [Theileria equi strain WA]|uniref:Uncharacterized protein n=1 Tax=Theileria equi strain WA TaxID=1537102 RepID=L0AYW3_THEEQ|nr:hypothetical protein BEWA_030640 [Theileria equi strain WA]AFZ80211.1 hypothetical protein BEWA_030640 [Theileria equi strain WA]|eukprot:XP_004829877.1 hypothetical protein BEWA_030640 [Theileria equi strain WA]